MIKNSFFKLFLNKLSPHFRDLIFTRIFKKSYNLGLQIL